MTILTTFGGLLLTVVMAGGIIALALYYSRRISNKVFDSTKYNYLRLSGVMGKAKILALTDTGKTLADIYTIMDADIEITNLNPSVQTKTQVAFLKSKIPAVGSEVSIKYDQKDPKVAMIVV